jgi:peptidoglycan/xylan/chitin deacetylase (PgdA/CDA1 family)
VTPLIRVLMLHGLVQRMPDYAIYPDGRSCLLRAKDFERVVGWCARRFRFLKVSEIDGYLASPSRGPAVALTFDDGLASVIDLALPVMRRYEATATVFVTTGWTDTGRAPAIFRYERALWERRGKHAAGEISRLWKSLMALKRAPLLWASNGESGSDDRQFWQPASWDELKSAVSEGLIEIGSHGVTHTPWTWLAERGELATELEASRDRIHDILGVMPTSCSYPHGLVDDRVAAQTARIYRWAFTNQRGILSPATDPLFAPRYHVPSERPVDMRFVLTMPRLGSAVRRLSALVHAA